MHISAIGPAINAAEMTIAEKGISSAKVILTGFVVVFAVLFLLIGIIKIYSAIVGKAQGTGKKAKKQKSKSPETPKRVTKAAEVTSQTAPEEASDAVPEEIIAVISAAVATLYGGRDKVRIKSVKKSSAGRPAWANAGVLDNTRPF